MYRDGKIWIGCAGEKEVVIYTKMANRHGMIAGATGTGKTVTLKGMAESFSDAGVAVFLADVKGDLAGMCKPGENSGTVANRINDLGLLEKGFGLHAYPTNFWDVYGEKGISLRTTISEMGPLLLSRIMDLNDIQSDILTIIFKIADDEGLLLLDTKDLKAMLNYVADNADKYSMEYGNMSKQSLAAIVRSVVALESEGGELFFGEPALDVKDMTTTTYDGKGTINILECQKLINNPKMYSTFMLWMLTELYETMPEVGDLDKPKMVFFFDEAHMLFESANKALLSKIEQVVKLIRSKGIGVYFITQNPQDIPDGVLAQLGNKVQHALRAYTPKELKGAKVAAESFRENPDFDTFTVLSEMGVGEALVSVLDEKGIPTIVERTSILPPQSYLGTITDDERAYVMQNSPLYDKYFAMVDRESAYECLSAKAYAAAEINAAVETDNSFYDTATQPVEEDAQAKRIRELEEQLEAEKAKAKESKIKKPIQSTQSSDSKVKKPKKDDDNTKAYKRAVKNVASTATGTIGREIGNTVGASIGGKFGKKLGGNVGASIGRNLLGVMFK